MFTYRLPQFGIVDECKFWIFRGAFSKPGGRRKNKSQHFVARRSKQNHKWLIDFHKQNKSLQRDSEENSSLSSYIVVHLFYSVDSVTITCVKWAPRPASGAWALAGPDTCPRSAVLATLDHTPLINRPVLIAETPLTGVAVTWILLRGDSELRGKCNGFCNIATHWDSELHQRPDVITCPRDAGSVFYDDYSENQVSAQIVMVLASIAPVLSIMSIQRGNKGL